MEEMLHQGEPCALDYFPQPLLASLLFHDSREPFGEILNWLMKKISSNEEIMLGSFMDSFSDELEVKLAERCFLPCKTRFFLNVLLVEAVLP